jgi:hypothetical protein
MIIKINIIESKSIINHYLQDLRVEQYEILHFKYIQV